ncbi:hypothetical protein ANSO36C_11080 [Nostoc cf. commune SO-36]|uniref:Transposase n=1 Tax=Nostoc cf. commune SO-36 TaxID=449208 RepID=A0ABN6PW60_NOSCO|nr:hypothetical protein ANSO36C_11080 [Nostoc cf. commune SO-36]
MTDNSFKRQQIISIVAIASTITDCSIFLQLGLNKRLSKIHLATSADTDPHAKAQAFVNNVLKGAKPGFIVLMHDGSGDV